MIDLIHLGIAIHLGCFALVVFIMAHESRKHRRK